MKDARAKPRIRRALARGLLKQCPRCGKGPLYEKRITTHEHCAVCGLQFLKNQGDPWGFLLLGDRLFLIPPIAAIYFGFLPESLLARFSLFIALAVLVIVTTPHRYGACIALDYVTRVRWGDLAEETVHAPPK